MLPANPTGNGALINLELFSGNLLSANEGNEVFVNTVHIAPPYGNTHIVDYGNTDLQGYGSTRNTRGMEFKDRLKTARRHAKLNQGELAAKAGITQTSISDLERGKSKATAHVVKIADACGVSAKWLSDEIGPMLAPGSSAGSAESNISVAAQPTKSFRYPVISWVAAGAWAEAVEPYPAGFSDSYEFSEYDSKGTAFWLKVKGDSMTAPAGQSITEGTLILVDTEAEVAPGKLVVAKLPDSNEATFKKLVSDGGRLFLKPLNPSYPIEAVDENCRIVGVVVQALQKFY